MQNAFFVSYLMIKYVIWSENVELVTASCCMLGYNCCLSYLMMKYVIGRSNVELATASCQVTIAIVSFYKVDNIVTLKKIC